MYALLNRAIVFSSSFMVQTWTTDIEEPRKSHLQSFFVSGVPPANSDEGDHRVPIEHAARADVAPRHSLGTVPGLPQDRVKGVALPRRGRCKPGPERVPGELRGIEPGVRRHAVNDVRDGPVAETPRRRLARPTSQRAAEGLP
jgi:hypothetical protein